MKNKMMAFTAEVSIGSSTHGYAGAASIASTGVVVTPQQEEDYSHCQKNCDGKFCSIQCPTGKAATCYCTSSGPVCKCV